MTKWIEIARGHVAARVVVLSVAAVACGGDSGGASAGASLGGSNGSGEEVLAVVDGTSITLADLDSRIGDQLGRMDFQYRSQRHQLIESALTDMIQSRLLTEEAAARGVSVDELVASTTEGKVEVTDAQVEDWYRRNRSRVGGQPFEDVSPQIRTFLEDAERAELVNALARQLEAEREVVYYMEPARAEFDLTGAPSAGPEDAAVTLVEFSDFECPFCGRFFPTVNEIKEKYGDRVRFVYLQFPLTNLHPNAFKAAEASLCAHEQDSFWEMHDLMFTEQSSLGVPELKEKASRLGLDTEEFDACLDSGRQAERIRADMQQGTTVGVSGTPALFVNGVNVPGGAVPYETVAAAIDRELQRADSD